MARSKNGNGRLEEALTTLIQTQAAFTQTQQAFSARMAETDRINSERFAHIENILLEHSRILGEHSLILAEYRQILEALPEAIRDLPEAIRDKFGFKLPKTDKEQP